MQGQPISESFQRLLQNTLAPLFTPLVPGRGQIPLRMAKGRVVVMFDFCKLMRDVSKTFADWLSLHCGIEVKILYLGLESYLNITSQKL